MCLNCGCQMAHDDHRNESNITYEDVKRAAQANKMGVAESLRMTLLTAEDRVQHRDEYETGEHAITSTASRSAR